MKNFNILIFIIFLNFFTFCSDKKGLKLEILNKRLTCYSFESKKDKINIISYKITNSSDSIYYLNNICNDKKLIFKSVYKSGQHIRVFNTLNNKEVDYITISPFYLNYPTAEDEQYSAVSVKRMILNSERNGYNQVLPAFYSAGGYNNFFIHPNESLYFEYCINLTDTISNEDFRIGYADLKGKTSYRGKLSIASDSTNYKNVLPRNILETIKANNVKVYHGIIESKNIVPIKVLE